MPGSVVDTVLGVNKENVTKTLPVVGLSLVSLLHPLPLLKPPPLPCQPVVLLGDRTCTVYFGNSKVVEVGAERDYTVLMFYFGK